MERQILEGDRSIVIGTKSKGSDISVSINDRNRGNTAVIGENSCGKSTVMRQMIMDDIEKGMGVMVIDPHREMAREILAMVPENRKDDVVFISLASMFSEGKTVTINPLDSRSSAESFIRLGAVVEQIKEYIGSEHDPKAANILVHVMRVFMCVPDMTVHDIIRFVHDPDHRKSILAKCHDRHTSDFWESSFPLMHYEPGEELVVTLSKILDTPPVRALFGAPEQTVSMRSIINQNKILVVDLGSGTTPDLVRHVGDMLLKLMLAENRVMNDVSHKPAPFNVYVEEGHMFGAATLKELLRQSRDNEQKVTVSLNSLDIKESCINERMWDLFDSAIAFKSGYSTTKILAGENDQVGDTLTGLDYHEFCVVSKRGTDVVTKGVPRPVESDQDWRKTAALSLKNYGRPVQA